MKYTNKAANNFFNELELDDIVVIGNFKHPTLVYDAKGLKEHLSNYHYKILCGIFDQEELDHVRIEYNSKTFELKKPPKQIIGMGQWHTKQ